jgi:carboxylesterase
MFVVLALLGVLTALAVVPIDTGPFASNPHPLADYARAVAAYDSTQQVERDSVMRDGGSLLYVHGHRTPRSVVLVHGITNSPRQFRELAEQLYDRGYNVIVPRLPEHGLRGADVSRLQTLTAERYRDFADRAVDIAAGLGDSVLVIGLSTGGNVAAWIAHHRPDVRRVLVVAPALSLGKTPRPLDAPLMNVLERVPNITIRKEPDTSRMHAYFGVSSRAVGEMLRFGTSVVEDAKRGAPVVRDVRMVLNKNDHTIDPGSAGRLAALWTAHDSTIAPVFWLDQRLGLPHDLIDVTQKCGVPAVVYSTLIALLEKRDVPENTVVGPCGA